MVSKWLLLFLLCLVSLLSFAVLNRNMFNVRTRVFRVDQVKNESNAVAPVKTKTFGWARMESWNSSVSKAVLQKLPKSCLALSSVQVQVKLDSQGCWESRGEIFEYAPNCGREPNDQNFVVLDVSDYNKYEGNVFHFTADNVLPIIWFFDSDCGRDLGKNFSVFLYFSQQWTSDFQSFFIKLLKSHGVRFFYNNQRNYAFRADVVIQGSSTSYPNLYGLLAPSKEEFLRFMVWKDRIWKALQVTPIVANATRQPKHILIQRRARRFELPRNVDNWFKVVDLAALSIEDQVKTVYDADILVGSHGAGLVHALWMRPGSVMVQVFPWYLCTWSLGLLEYGNVAAVGGVLPQSYCIERTNVRSKEVPPQNFVNSDINLQHYLYAIESLILTQKDLSNIRTMAEQLWQSAANTREMKL